MSEAKPFGNDAFLNNMKDHDSLLKKVEKPLEKTNSKFEILINEHKEYWALDNQLEEESIEVPDDTKVFKAIVNYIFSGTMKYKLEFYQEKDSNIQVLKIRKPKGEARLEE